MKYYLKFQLVLLLVLSFSQVQSQMLEIGKQWIFEDMHYSNIWFPYSDTTIETITITKDTLINSLLYKQLVLSRHPGCWNTGNPEYLRDDGDKIFRLSRNLEQEFLMIDFAEEDGYEMLYDFYTGEIDTGTVVIDSFGAVSAYDGSSLEVQYMKILNNQSYDDETTYKVYKDIGFLYPGFLFPDLGTGLCDFQDGITLRCVVNNQDTIRFTEFDCFELQVINNISQVPFEDIVLSPNPSTDFVTVPQGLEFLILVDLYGSVLKPKFDDTRIYLSSFPIGSYFAKFIDSTKEKTYIGRILKL